MILKSEQGRQWTSGDIKVSKELAMQMRIRHSGKGLGIGFVP